MTRLHLALLFFAFLLPLVTCNEDDLMVEDEEYDDILEDEPVEEEEEEEIPEVFEEPDYTVVEAMTNSLLFENFQDAEHIEKFWTHSSSPDFPGRFQVGKGGKNPTLSSELGLFVPKEAQRYAIFGETSRPFEFASESTFVVQYELRLHEPLQCGGAYIKLTAEQGGDWTASDITNETPYTFMFGPDKCGSTNKVHFIYRFQNPVTSEYAEHHLESPPMPAGTSDKQSHLYTLVVRSDNTYEIFIDKDSKKKGSLLEDFDPPLNPPKQIDDPEDFKPEDWVDEAKIADPEAEKPDDWDEDAPREIDDPEATKPEGWEDDEPEEIPDPEASQPEDWDEEDDGEWEAPLVANPKCSVGCGEWSPPRIANPDYKGKWFAPMIDNPEYIGEWKAQQIDNPAFFEESDPWSKFDSVAGVAIDIWTMQKGIEYDNVYIGTSEDAAYELAANWQIRKAFQKQNMASAGGDDGPSLLDTITEFVEENMMAVAGTVAILVMTIIYFACCGSEELEPVGDEAPAAAEPEAEPAAAPKTKDKRDPTKADPAKKEG